jgi:fluoride exporter
VHVLMQIGLVALGSALGGVLRFGVGTAFTHFLAIKEHSYPWGTFVINITGSLFLGWFYIFTERHCGETNAWLRENLRLLLAVGVAGGYTTFSSFEWEADRLIEHGEWWRSAAYIAGSVFLGLVALRLGVLLARMG